MKKYLIMFSFLLCTTFAYADSVQQDEQVKFGEDVLATAINYKTFETGFSGLISLIREYSDKKNFQMLCEVSKMTHEFMVNNMKYSQEFNSKHPNLNYETLLNKLTQDNYDNKDGCTGKTYFTK